MGDFKGLLNLFQLWDFSLFFESHEEDSKNLRSLSFYHIYNGAFNDNISSVMLGSQSTSKVLFKNIRKIYVNAWSFNSESPAINIYCAAP